LWKSHGEIEFQRNKLGKGYKSSNLRKLLYLLKMARSLADSFFIPKFWTVEKAFMIIRGM
jgi:hypothetical protein